MTTFGDTGLGKSLKRVSRTMVALSALAFVLPIFLMYTSILGDTRAFEATQWLAHSAFFIASMFAGLTIYLFCLKLKDLFDVADADEFDKRHRRSLKLFLPTIVLIITAVAIRILEMLRIIDPPMGIWQTLFILPGIIVASSLLALDATLISASKDGKLREIWIPFAREAFKLDLGVFAAFISALVFVGFASAHVDSGHPHELQLIIAGLEAALLTVSTVAFSFDSGGVFKKRIDALISADSSPPGPPTPNLGA